MIALTEIEQIKQLVAESCHQFGVKRLDLFGSMARGEATPQSDLDFLVWFIAPQEAGISNRFFGLLHALEDNFQRPVDLLTEKALQNPYLQATINSQRVCVYQDLNNESLFLMPRPFLKGLNLAKTA